MRTYRRRNQARTGWRQFPSVIFAFAAFSRAGLAFTVTHNVVSRTPCNSAPAAAPASFDILPCFTLLDGTIPTTGSNRSAHRAGNGRYAYAQTNIRGYYGELRMVEKSYLSHETSATANQACSGESCNGDQASDSRDPHQHSRLSGISSRVLIAALISFGIMFYSATPSAADDSAPTPPATAAAVDNSMGMDWNGSGAGGSMQWVPDPTISQSKDSDIDTATNEKVESSGAKPKDDTDETSEPLIDEYGSELPPATATAKPFDYQGAADDLFASPSSPSPSPTTQMKADGGNAFDDSRFSMDKDDKEVVENLSFRLYDGRSKR